MVAGDKKFGVVSHVIVGGGGGGGCRGAFSPRTEKIVRLFPPLPAAFRAI